MANERNALVPQAEVDELRKQLDAVKRQDIALLGDSQVFVRRIPGGQIKAVKGVMTLKESNGEIAVVSGKCMSTAKGLNVLNQIAGLSIITPERLTLPEGHQVVNPYPIVDPESGSISKVWVRKLALGYSPTGNLVVTSATLLYDIKMYFIQDLVKKVQNSKGAGRVCMEAQLTGDEKSGGIFLRIDGLLGVWASYNHPDVLKALDTFIGKKLFAERNAQSICERLVMARHPALAHAVYVDATGPDRGHSARVPVVGYVNDLTREQMLNVASQAERGEVEIKIGNQTAEVIETTGTATADEIATEVDDEERATVESTHVEGQTIAQVGGLFDTGGERL